jgi:hypothetical protein
MGRQEGCESDFAGKGIGHVRVGKEIEADFS